jgi:hypothetical protein
MIFFNPFRLTNLTHTFEISISEHAASWRAVNEWRPAFDWMDPTTDRPNPVGEEEGFGVMCIVGLFALLVWLIFHTLKPSLRPVRNDPSCFFSSDPLKPVAQKSTWPDPRRPD